MKGKKLFVLMLVVTGVTLSMSIPAMAQTNETTPTNGTNGNNGDNQSGENSTSVMEIGPHVDLVDYEVNDDNVMTITLESSVHSRPVKITDMNSGKGQQGAYQFDTKSATLSKGTNKIQMKLTPDGGRVEASIATHGGTIGIAKGTSSNLFTKNYSGEMVIAMMVLSGIVGVTVVGISAFKREQDISENIEQEL